MSNETKYQIEIKLSWTAVALITLLLFQCFGAAAQDTIGNPLPLQPAARNFIVNKSLQVGNGSGTDSLVVKGKTFITTLTGTGLSLVTADEDGFLERSELPFEVLSVHLTPVSSDEGVQTTLMGDTLPANTADVGDVIEIFAWGRYADNPGGKQLDFTLGGSGLGFPGSDENFSWHAHMYFIIIDSTHASVTCDFLSSPLGDFSAGTSRNYTQTEPAWEGITLAADMEIFLIGTSDSADDIIFQGGTLTINRRIE